MVRAQSQLLYGSRQKEYTTLQLNSSKNMLNDLLNYGYIISSMQSHLYSCIYSSRILCCFNNSLLTSAALLSNAFITNSLTLSANRELTLLYNELLKSNLRCSSMSHEFFLAFGVIVHFV